MPGPSSGPSNTAAIVRWMAGRVENFLWLVNYYTSEWADALNRKFT